MKFFLGLFFIVLYGFGCANKKTTEQLPQQPDTSINTKTSFFPVTSFLKGQMLPFDSMPVTPLHTITIKEKKGHKKPGFGLVTELVEAFNQHNELVMVCEHILLVNKKEP